MNNSIIFNCLIHESIYQPSLSLSILKTFFAKKNIDSNIIYWNILLEAILKKYLGNETISEMDKSLIFFPLLNELGIDYDRNGLAAHLQAINPEKKFKNSVYYNKMFTLCSF